MPVQSSLVVRDGTAICGNDYNVELEQSFQILPGGRRCTTVMIIDDEDAEKEEMFFLSLTSSNMENVPPFQATVTITDNDVITFQESMYSTVEGEDGVEVCVSLPGGSGTKIGRITTESGSATERLDFFPLRRASFTITGTEVRCFFIYNYRDNLIEPQEEFTVKVYTLVTDQFAVDFHTTRVILEDDDMMCPALTDPANGEVSVPGLTVNSVATYTCSSGYSLVGDTQRVCMANGEWIGIVPVCQLIECPVLPPPTNGTISLPSVRTPGTLAEYTCLSGHVLLGDRQRVCLDSGVWNGTEPSCLGLQNMEPVAIRLVNDSPKIDGTTVSIEVSVSGPVNKVICSLDKKVVAEEDFRNRDRSRMDFTNVSPGSHTLEVIATSLLSEERAYVERFFEIGSSPTFCGIHLINDGFVVNTHNVKVEFAALPTAESYQCELDGQPGCNCVCKSPVELSGLRPGPHQLRIAHNKDGCGYRRELLISFNIDNTPDNPHNNI